MSSSVWFFEGLGFEYYSLEIYYGFERRFEIFLNLGEEAVLGVFLGLFGFLKSGCCWVGVVGFLLRGILMLWGLSGLGSSGWDFLVKEFFVVFVRFYCYGF